MRSLAVFFFEIVLLTNCALGQKLVKPFQTHNQSPLVHFFGIPTNPGGSILEKNSFCFGNYFSIANNATSGQINEEAIYLDGEMYRNELFLSYGLFSKLEVGIVIPVVRHSSGVMDSFISNWHDAFNLPGKSRDVMPAYNLNYFFMEEEEIVFEMNESKLSFGDISFSMGTPIIQSPNHDLSFRTFVKIPTGNKTNLVGSGTSDFGFQITGMLNSTPERKQFSFYYSGGYLRIGKGALLENKVTRNVGFGSFGLAFNANNNWYLKSQLDFHTSLYEKSYTKQLGKASAQLVLGLDYFVAKDVAVSLAFVEDIIVNTAPDFVLQMGVSYQF
ncbi:DUF3187 family protein [Labilibaculum sp. A4]|uniref:DUF3187 family protein n=1 Tax=Labilibaculum euxinus TaxID=2686357 RepID=UPI000F625ADE|nr:DUF3187 family protein [Labilibaculum euxinus]MDQ1772972.1 DUF3187 family protein [Labilibaculum euxinus]MWN77215.1 DUF3187 family protein [Labilibaculum euxinus]